jgi:hypothetical protein
MGATLIYHVSVVVPCGFKRFLVHYVPNGYNPTSDYGHWRHSEPKNLQITLCLVFFSVLSFWTVAG